MKDSLTVYPNPTYGDIILNTDVEIKKIYIYDLSDNLIEKYRGSFHVNLSHLDTGIYKIKLLLKNGSTVQAQVKLAGHGKI